MMLTLPSWEPLNLTLNFFSTKYITHTNGCLRLPQQMRVKISTMDELPCYDEDHALECSFEQEEENDEEYVYMEPHMDDESSTSSNPSVEEVKELLCSNKPPERIRQCRKASGLTSFSGIEDGSMKQLRQKSTPSNSEV
ncbi:hypothetical protein HPP92_007290 [Vanilla planifolia]|uniref:Uncharacterized protein n=1 Tax=Vanilla planifolia TaxID=51239 RepID=A0A835RR34_VANPL|nr:hypothetical protein HPP92_007290 [Vanilla planifolia]